MGAPLPVSPVFGIHHGRTEKRRHPFRSERERPMTFGVRWRVSRHEKAILAGERLMGCWKNGRFAISHTSHTNGVLQ